MPHVECATSSPPTLFGPTLVGGARGGSATGGTKALSAGGLSELPVS
ncbi:unnamed protein product [Tuber aestivum]|uniref:Uncharacterized protein n=1 Tax=Tuber aestivum TaxID=59557 RepID=A0A292Q3I7_9PEZI|nr:unnamed protein product [Tuber aestivum]